MFGDELTAAWPPRPRPPPVKEKAMTLAEPGSDRLSRVTPRPDGVAPRVSRGGLGRRRFLEGGAGAFLAAASTAGGEALSTSPSGDAETERAQQKKGPQAPMLAKLVEKGELPDVDERLPAKPLVVEPVERVGVYGGEWRFLSP